MEGKEEDGMTGQELVDFINMNDLGDWEFEVKVHGQLIRIVDAARCDGIIRLYPEESDE